MSAMAESYIAKPLSPLRKVIAARMADAKRTIPHFRLGADIETDALQAVLRELRARWPGRPLSLNDLLIKACATALQDAPDVNVQWAETQIHQFSSVDISVVTAIAGGLSTPIIRNADGKTVWEIAGEVRAMSERAARNALRMEEVFGGSFSISNLGMYGVDEFDAVINPPQCAILAVARARRRVVVAQNDEMRIATVMRVTLSLDHRAIDGTSGATFLSALRDRVEQPDHLRSDD
jgi:pyruvate dehydrogenase E2 component (dihydrolipoamide acetyltransferase)